MLVPSLGELLREGGDAGLTENRQTFKMVSFEVVMHLAGM